MLRLFLFIFGVCLVVGSPINDDHIHHTLGLLSHDHKAPEVHEPEIYRLQENVYPLRYTLKIQTDMEKSTFSGDVEITIRTKFPTNTITLHSNVTVKDCQVRRGNNLMTSSFNVDKLQQLLIIKLPKIPYGVECVLSIKFEGVLEDDMLGFYKTTYTDDKGTKKIAAVTKFEPTYARKAFPCFDEPRYKTPFTIIIAHNPEQNVISNMPIQSTTINVATTNNRQLTTFQTTPPISTYLVAFMVGEFPSKTSSEKIVTVYARPNAIQYATYATEQGQKLFNSMLDLTGVDYPLPKLDIIALPDFVSGAMENWGMTTYREKFVLLDEANSPETHKSLVTEVISHEFSHQWFGDLVTPAWWDYLWLNEGFATYYEYFNTQAVESTWDLEQLFVSEEVQYALWNEIPKQRAMTSRVRYPSETRAIFDVISYTKAGSVIRMFEHIMTTNGFRSALNRYLLDGYKNYGGTVTPNILFKAFEVQAAVDSPRLPPHVSITDTMKSWSENIRYPLISVKRDASSKTVKFEQSTYKSTRSPTPTPDQEWIVPITYATKSTEDLSDTRPTLWSLARRSAEISNIEPTDWVLCNLQQSGYYRVNYCHHGWQLLIQQLKNDLTKIPILNRAQLLDDAFALAMEGNLCYHIPLMLSSYLEKEKEITPWLTLTKVLDRIHSQFQHTGHFSNIRIFIEEIVETAYKNLGYEIKPTDSHLVKVGKPSILWTAARCGQRKIIDLAVKDYQDHVNDLTKVQPDMKRLVFCNALRHADKPEEVYNNLWSTYLKSNIAFDSNVILMILGCAKDEAVLRKVLVKVLDPKNDEIRKQDMRYFDATFFSFPESVTTTLKVLSEKAGAITLMNDKEYEKLQNVMSNIPPRIQTNEQIRLLEELQIKTKNLNPEKYGAFSQLVHLAHCDGKKRIEANEKLAEQLSHKISTLDSHDDGKDVHPTKTPISAAPTSSSSWLCVVVAVFFTCKNLI